MKFETLLPNGKTILITGDKAAIDYIQNLRAGALEEAALICDDMGRHGDDTEWCAREIRKLKDKL